VTGARYHAPMHLHTIEILVAVAASVILLMQVPAKLFAGLALVASALEALLVFHVIQFSIRGVNLWLVLGATLAVCATIVWARNQTKLAVTAATALALIGAMQVAATIG
jgi:hypothetical protein